MADINELDVVPKIQSRAPEQKYVVYESESETISENEVTTKVFQRLKKNNLVSPNTDREIEVLSQLSRILSLYELRLGVPIGSLRPSFSSSRTPNFQVVLANGRKFEIAIPKKNFQMKNPNPSSDFPEEVNRFFNERPESNVDDGLDNFFRKLEVFIERYGEKQRLVYYGNPNQDETFENFRDKIIEEEADSFVSFNFLRG